MTNIIPALYLPHPQIVASLPVYASNNQKRKGDKENEKKKYLLRSIIGLHASMKKKIAQTRENQQNI